MPVDTFEYGYVPGGGLNRAPSLHSGDLPAAALARMRHSMSAQRRSLCHDGHHSEFRAGMDAVWGQSSTPALQTLECIQQVKRSISQQADEDSLSSAAFSWMVGASFLTILIILLVWELYFRPDKRA